MLLNRIRDLVRRDGTEAEVASLMVASDLRVAGSNHAWRLLNLPKGERANERIDKIFPGSEVASYVLDVLASGEPFEHVVARIGAAADERFFSLTFTPLPSKAKPKKVLIEACEMTARLVLDRRTGRILDSNKSAREIFGDTHEAARFLRTVDGVKTALGGMTRTRSQYLGTFKHCRADGCVVEVESVLTRVGV